MVNPDISPTPEVIERLIEQYGSLAHLADQLGVDIEQLKKWRDGAEKIPLSTFARLVEIVLRPHP